MTSSENPWAEVFTQPQQKRTARIIPFFTEQAKMLSGASNGRVRGRGVFLRLLT